MDAQGFVVSFLSELSRPALGTTYRAVGTAEFSPGATKPDGEADL
jgi:hypothetical protein